MISGEADETKFAPKCLYFKKLPYLCGYKMIAYEAD